jgi:hypothetical protein
LYSLHGSIAVDILNDTFFFLLLIIHFYLSLVSLWLNCHYVSVLGRLPCDLFLEEKNMALIVIIGYFSPK